MSQLEKEQTKVIKSSSSNNRRKAFPPKKRDSGTIVHVGNKRFKIPITTMNHIIMLQQSVHFLIPRRNFARLVKEVFLEMECLDMRIQATALEALQTATELYLVNVFEDANLLCTHARRITVKLDDMQLACKFRNSK